MDKNVGGKNEHFPFDLNWWDLRALRRITQSIAIRAQQPIYPLTVVTHQNKAKMPITHSSQVFAKPPIRDHDSRYGLSNLNINLLAINLWNHHQIEMSSDSEAEESKEEAKSTSPNNPIHRHQGTTTHLPTDCRDPSKQSQNAHHPLFSSVRQAIDERPWFQIWALQSQCQSPSYQSLKRPPNRDE